MTAETPGVAADLSDDDLLKRPGVMRACWWSRCLSCSQRINERDVQGLSVVDGHQVWVCRGCYLEREVPP